MARAAMLFLCAIVSFAAFAEEAQPSDAKWRKVRAFRGKVVDITMAKREFREINGKQQLVIIHDGALTIIGVDPRWILKVSFNNEPEGKAQEVVYAIHSPTEIFFASKEDSVGKVFDFTEYEWAGAAPKLTNRLEVKPLTSEK